MINLCEHVDLFLTAVLGDLDPLVDEPDPDVVGLDVGQVGPQVPPHLFVDGQRRDLNPLATAEQTKFGLKHTTTKIADVIG